MSAQDTPYSRRLLQLETFGSAVWGNNSIFKMSTRPSGSNTRPIEYLDFAEHHAAVRSFCRAVDNKLVVFKEYGAAMDRFKKKDALYKNGACIIGQPGIGKTSFIAYAVIERLRKKQPVAVEVAWRKKDPKYILFTATSVTLYNEEDTDPLEDHPGIWAFSDSNATVHDPIITFQDPPHVRIFQTTSPAEHRWNEWTKQCMVNRYTMDVPSIEEVENLAIILGKNVEHMKTLADKWGNVPRILLRILEAPESEKGFEQMVTAAVREATANPEFVLKAITNHNGSEVRGSSTIFFIKPKSETHRTLPSVYVPTHWLTSQLVDGLSRRQENERAKFLGIMSVHSC